MNQIHMGYKKHQFTIIPVTLKLKRISTMVGIGLIYLMKRIQYLNMDHFLGNFFWGHYFQQQQQQQQQ